MNNLSIKYFEAMRETIAEKEQEKTALPYSIGAMKAYRCYEQSVINNCAFIECGAVPQPEEFEDFIHVLCEADVKSIVVTDNDSGLNDFLRISIAKGCTVLSTQIIKREPPHSDANYVIGLLILMPITDKS